jgi:hypothetical protein
MFDFYKYIETFNAGDDKSMLDRFWVNDLEAWSGRGGEARLLASGKEGFLNFLNFAHDGVRELMRVQVLLQNEANIFAEIDMDFVFSKDRPDYPFGNRRAGERITVKMFCLYFLRGDKIAKMKMASWAPDQGVSSPPTQGFGPPFPM